MIKIKTLFWITILFSTACSNELKQQPLDTDAVIVAFGDSLTVGYGTSQQNSYPSQLNNMLTQNVINAGVSGEETTSSLGRINAVLKKHHPALVLLCIGGNDFLRKRSSATTERNIGQLIDKIHQSGSRVVLIAVPELGLFLNPSKIYYRLAESHNVLLIENALSDLISDNQFKSDTIHLNAKGYGLLAEKIYGELQDFGLIE